MKMIKSLIVGVAAAMLIALPAFSADMAVKAPPNAFGTSASSGPYVGLGSTGAVASGSVQGNVFPSNLTASGASVDVDGGYLWGSCVMQTWCQFETNLRYSNVGGSNGDGSVTNRWSVSAEFDVGAEIFNTMTSYLGNLGTGFPTFNPQGFLPAASVGHLDSPRQYIGFKGEADWIDGTLGSAAGQTVAFAPGITTGWRWRTLGANGQPNGGSLKVFADVLWEQRGVELTGILASGGKPPALVTGSSELSTIYRVGVHYDLGVAPLFGR